jgi:uncharacterized protein YchJ
MKSAKVVGGPTTAAAPAHAIRARFCTPAARTLAVVNPLPDFLQPLESLIRPFPREAVAAAIARRAEAIPHLLQALAWADQHTDEANSAQPPYMLHLFALFLLAQFREPRAYPLIVRLARNPEIEALTGDVITEQFRNILASVCGGDTTLIEQLIEDPDADEWVRGAAVGSFGVLLHTGGKTREQVSAYLGELFASRLEREPGHVWDSAISLCTDFGFAEHLAAVRKIYRAGLADPFCDALEDVEAELALPPGTSTRVRWDRYELIDDAIAEMESWYCFTARAAEEDEDDELGELDALEDTLLDDEDDELPGTPAVRETPKIGRNEQCPCGSGKKYKKCCGKLGAA